MPGSDWVPVVADVGAILRARTVDTNGNELGTFTAATRPTTTQVAAMLVNAQTDIASHIGWDVPIDVQDQAKATAALGAALLIELTYFPEQVATGRSPYEQLKELYDERMARLKVATAEAGGDVPGDVPGAVPPPAFAFPLGGPRDMIGHRTVW